MARSAGSAHLADPMGAYHSVTNCWLGAFVLLGIVGWIFMLLIQIPYS